VETSEENVNQKEQKVFLIPVAYAIVDPRTMMVHSSDALLASGAVMTLWNLYFVALFAHSLEN